MVNYEDAIADYDQALQLQPGHASAYHNRVLAKLNAGQDRNPMADYDQALQFLPDFAASY